MTRTVYIEDNERVEGNNNNVGVAGDCGDPALTLRAGRHTTALHSTLTLQACTIHRRTRQNSDKFLLLGLQMPKLTRRFAIILYFH